MQLYSISWGGFQYSADVNELNTSRHIYKYTSTFHHVPAHGDTPQAHNARAELHSIRKTQNTFYYFYVFTVYDT